MGTAERKAREKSMRQRQILRASYRVFDEVGFSAATMDQIAERAELAKGTIYLYFKSKEEVYFSLLTDGLDILIRLLQEIDSQAPPPERLLERTAATLLRFYQEHTGYFRMFMLMQQEDMRAKLSTELTDRINERATSILNLMARQIVQYGKGPAASPETAWQVANVLWGAFNGIAQLTLTRERLKARPSRIEDLLHLCFTLIECGLQSWPEPVSKGCSRRAKTQEKPAPRSGAG
jgi:AcrR family transcriptional regulator